MFSLVASLRHSPPSFAARFPRVRGGLLLGAFAVAAAAASAAEPVPQRVYTATRIEGVGHAPSIDGKLDDACWQLGEWSGDYLQREPFERAAPTQPTQLKILYDQHNVYVAIRALDPQAKTEPRLLGQRDEFAGDMVGIAFDSYLNRRTAFEFDVTSGGSKIDLIIRNDGTIDTNWNPVWEVRVSTDATGWSAEYRIPLSQLRYSRARQQVWGLHSWRWIRRKQEESDWQFIPMDNTGFVRAFGELRGIEDLPPSRRIEIMPFVAAKYESLEKEPGNPYRSRNSSSGDAGVDAKIGLSSDFTLDLTVNPDFGQVEADPAEINLSTVETFFPEKRPFFIEGKSLFEYGLEDDTPFYSRRIGDAPSIVPDSTGFVKMPANNRILSAEKITGRTENGFSLGVLHALTDRSEARIVEPGSSERRVLAEPLTNYFVARVQNDFAGGDTIVGGLLTATQRIGSKEELCHLPRQALTGGLDLTHYWSGRTYFLEAKGLATQVTGSTTAITGLMDNLVHNYSRPDADYLELDRTADELAGNGGRVRVGKGANGQWRYFGGVSWRSPGLDFNDLGYLAYADYVQPIAQLQYYDVEPGRWLRRRDFRLKEMTTLNYGGDTLSHSVVMAAEFAGLKGWYLAGDTRYETSRLDTRMLRGGPALRRPDRFPTWLYFESEGGRSTQFRLSSGFVTMPEDDSRYFELEPGIVHRVGDRLRFDLKLGYAQSLQQHQYAGQSDTALGKRYLVAHLDQQTIWSQLRMQANFSPTLSLTYFAGPYASVGRFTRFKVVSAPRASRDSDRYSALQTTRIGDTYAARWGGETFGFDDPDFSWRELNSNLVLKWEFRAGSTLYCVWSQHRGDGREFGGFGYEQEYRRLLEAHPDNTLLVKMSYWFSI